MNAIREGIQDSFLYHGNSRMAKVLQRSESNTYQVHLMTFTAKGAPKRDLCVYLTENECEELEKSFLKLMSVWRIQFHKARKFFSQHTSGH